MIRGSGLQADCNTLFIQICTGVDEYSAKNKMDAAPRALPMPVVKHIRTCARFHEYSAVLCRSIFV